MKRCDITDLFTDQCGHCIGSQPLVIPPQPRRGDDPKPGRALSIDTPVGEVPVEVTLPTTWRDHADGGECRCGRPTRDDAYVCDQCVDLLARALGDVPWIIEQLAVTIAGQRAAALSGNGGSNGDAKLPFNETASDAQTDLHSTMAMWVRWCIEEHVRASNPGREWPENTPQSMSTWLLRHVDGLALHETGPDAIDEIIYATQECRRIVLWTATPKLYLGPCEGAIDDEGAEIECDGEVYAKEGDDTGRCNECRRSYAVADKRVWLETALSDSLMTVSEIARAAVFLGLEVPRERIRKAVDQWQRRGRIIAKGHNESGVETFRYGDVRPLLYAAYARQDTTGKLADITAQHERMGA